MPFFNSKRTLVLSRQEEAFLIKKARQGRSLSFFFLIIREKMLFLYKKFYIKRGFFEF